MGFKTAVCVLIFLLALNAAIAQLGFPFGWVLVVECIIGLCIVYLLRSS